MNVKEYIESGILEAYILGALPPGEEILVEANIAQFPELGEELLIIESAMQQFASTISEAPPAGLDTQIWNAIQDASAAAEKNINSHIFNNVAGTKTSGEPSKTIPLTPKKSAFNWKYAALLAALTGSLVFNAIQLFQQGLEGVQSTQRYVMMESRLQNGQAVLAAQIEGYKKEKAMMADTGMQTIVMHTIQKGHPMAATLYWSKNTGEAYVTADALPMPPKGMQYQLWAIQGGKPVDMGMLPNEIVNNAAMQKVNKAVLSGEAFAISLEKEGGSPTPTAANIYVMGKA